MLVKVLALVAVAVAAWAVLTAIAALVFMLAFNLVAPAFGWPTIDFPVAFGVVVLIEFIGSALRTVFSRN